MTTTSIRGGYKVSPRALAANRDHRRLAGGRQPISSLDLSLVWQARLSNQVSVLLLLLLLQACHRVQLVALPVGNWLQTQTLNRSSSSSDCGKVCLASFVCQVFACWFRGLFVCLICLACDFFTSPAAGRLKLMLNKQHCQTQKCANQLALQTTASGDDDDTDDLLVVWALQTSARAPKTTRPTSIATG